MNTTSDSILFSPISSENDTPIAAPNTLDNKPTGTDSPSIILRLYSQDLTSLTMSTSSNEASPSQDETACSRGPLEEFHLFPDLPLELRLVIWELALTQDDRASAIIIDDRGRLLDVTPIVQNKTQNVVKKIAQKIIRKATRKKEIIQNEEEPIYVHEVRPSCSFIPALLQVNSNFREVAEKRYQPAFTPLFGTPLRFDFSKDVHILILKDINDLTALVNPTRHPDTVFSQTEVDASLANVFDSLEFLFVGSLPVEHGVITPQTLRPFNNLKFLGSFGPSQNERGGRFSDGFRIFPEPRREWIDDFKKRLEALWGRDGEASETSTSSPVAAIFSIDLWASSIKVDI